MNRKKLIAMISIAVLSIGLLSGCGCAANIDEPNASSTQSESAAEQGFQDEQTSGNGIFGKKDAANDDVGETEIVDEAEIELENGEASGGM